MRLIASGAIFALLVGCGGSNGSPIETGLKSSQVPASHKEIKVQDKITKNISVDETPSSFEQYALLSNGKINFNGSFETDGPLADVHSNQEIVSNSRSVNITGRVTAYNGTSGEFRSVGSDVQSAKRVDFRALKVHEYDVNNSLPDAYILKKDGTFVKRFNNQETLSDKSVIDATLTYSNGVWSIKGKSLHVDFPIKCESDLNIDVDKLFIGGSLLVEGDLTAKGKLSINVGTPFENGLIVDGDIVVDKLDIIGKIFGSGKFIGKSTINITGSAKIDGDVSLNGKTKLNYLDTVYQAAMSNAQDDFNNTDFMLVHSQLFENLKGKNSVVLFTFVKGNYLIDEDTLLELIETNSTKDFEFKSYLYGATLEYASDLAKFDSLAPYYQKKAEVIKLLKAKGYKDIEITESLDIAPEELYHTFSTKDGKKIGTYLIESAFASTDGLVELTDEKRAQAYKEKYDPQTKEAAKAELEKLKNEADLLVPDINNIDLDEIEARTDLNATQKQMIKEFVLENSIDANVTVNEELEKKEAAQDRIKEWIYEKETEGENIIKEVTVVAPDTNKRGWWSRLKRRVHRWWKRTKHRACYSVWTPPHFLRPDINEHINKETKLHDDLWTTDIAYGNDTSKNKKKGWIGNCVQTAAASMIRYLAIQHNRKVSPIYEDQTNFLNSREDPLDADPTVSGSYKSTLVTLLDKRFNGHSDGTVSPWDLFHRVPEGIRKTLEEGGIYASVWARINKGWWFSRSSWFRTIKSDINKGNPIMMMALNHQWIKNHAVVIIGYKGKEYKGWACSWKPNKNWIYCASGWNPGTSLKDKMWARYDSRTNYWTTPATFIRVKVNSVKREWSWWSRWWSNWYSWIHRYTWH